MSGWAAKQAKKAEWAEARKLDGLDATHKEVNDTRDAAMGKGEDQLFEKKLSKEEQKAEKERKLALKKLEREMQDGTASEETKAKMAEIEREAALKADSSLHIDTCIRTTSTLLENLKKDTDDLRFQKAYAEILKD